RGTGEGDGGDHPVGEERGTGERVRTTAGCPDARESRETERISDGCDIVRRRGDSATDLRSRPTVAGPGVRDGSDPAPSCRGDNGLEERARLRRPVVPEDGKI